MMTADFLKSSYSYNLPEGLIAQNPVVPRDSSRLLVIDSPTTHTHSTFRDLPSWLRPGDLLVLNNTRVIPARLYGRKTTGAPVEILLLQEQQQNCWLALVKPGKRFKVGTEICFEASPQASGVVRELRARAIARDEATGGRLLEFQIPEGHSLLELLADFGHVPLPPYITASESLPEQYQTVYAQCPGSAAAPTAGLHFTEELLERLTAAGIDQTYITLHVGVGTFRPVDTEDITSHQMHSEWVQVGMETVAKIRQTRTVGGRIIAVGTTVVRALEGAAVIEEQRYQEEGKSWECGVLHNSFRSPTNLFIYPGYRWRTIDGMITNFHLPGSSLLMLVSALIGRDRLLSLYREAIATNYRFYSFGDAMLILPEARQQTINHLTNKSAGD